MNLFLGGHDADALRGIATQLSDFGDVAIATSSRSRCADGGDILADEAAGLREGVVEAIRRADGVVVALPDCFVDGFAPGRVFECGLAVALGKPIVAWTSSRFSHAARDDAGIIMPSPPSAAMAAIGITAMLPSAAAAVTYLRLLVEGAAPQTGFDAANDERHLESTPGMRAFA